MNFFDLHERLRVITWTRLSHGASSRSLLARQTGLAQAHISNFLNRRRHLSMHALNRVLSAQSLSVEDLASPDLSDPSPPNGTRRAGSEKIPLVAQSVALTAPLIPPRAILDALHLPSGCLDGLPVRRSAGRRNWDRFVAVRVTAAQAAAMAPVLRPAAIAVIDRHYNSLTETHPPHPDLYAVRGHAQMLFRYVAFESDRLVLRPHLLESPIQLLELMPQETPADLIVGRICFCLSEP